MATQSQRRSINPNAKKIQARPKPASRQRAVQPASGLKRRLPGTGGEGHYYHIEMRSKRYFRSFRTEQIGRKGHIERVLGLRPNGAWETAKWLISKKDAHIQDGRLVPDSDKARDVLKQLGTRPVRVKGDLFKAEPPAGR